MRPDQHEAGSIKLYLERDGGRLFKAAIRKPKTTIQPSKNTLRNVKKQTTDQSMLWGLSLEFWDVCGLRLMLVGAGLGILALAVSLASSFILYKVAAVAQTSVETAQRASSERIAELTNESARLTSDNLSLQTALLPRHVGVFGINQRPPAEIWFAGIEQWTGTKVLVQATDGDLEAQNLASEICFVLAHKGWRPELVDAKRTGIDMRLQEGLRVFSPSSYKAWDPKNGSQQGFKKLGDAARSLATALTNAGLGVGSNPVPGVRGLLIVVDFPNDSEAAASQYGKFDPPLDGVYLQVGSRPVAATVQWMKQGRLNKVGKPSLPAEAPTQDK